MSFSAAPVSSGDESIDTQNLEQIFPVSPSPVEIDINKPLVHVETACVCAAGRENQGQTVSTKSLAQPHRGPDLTALG